MGTQVVDGGSLGWSGGCDQRTLNILILNFKFLMSNYFTTTFQMFRFIIFKFLNFKFRFVAGEPGARQGRTMLPASRAHGNDGGWRVRWTMGMQVVD